ncbi:hypothetical protein [Caloranaerobacter azorensis]|uniref:ABC-2 family transporter protein n=1 Tax=Caloranaerobacter azorensis DSM 13643 TaxID=1121264 RepID=A0A1M5W121_9FIRM|nr:hypothetical protein [Caloranaerobacter azorensis]SHH81216.1 hypothetical protein SAMN02745135_02237 [Caloranaerobacter azorensis DSM 13643]
MKALILSELERIWGRKRTGILFILNIVLIFMICAFVNFYKVGFYGPNAYIKLNSLNFSPFVLREGHIILACIICPIIFIDCLNYEKTSGGFRLYMIRAYDKFEYIVSKWIALSITLFIFVISIFIVSNVFGFTLMPKTEYTELVNVQGEYGLISALLYNIKFYMIEYMILLCILGIASLVSVLVPNAVLAVIATIAVIVGSIYVWDGFSFLLFSTDEIFNALGGINTAQFFISLIGIILITVLSSGVIWKKKGYYF